MTKATPTRRTFGYHESGTQQRRFFCFGVGTFVFCCLFAMTPTLSADANQSAKFNVVMIISDDHGWRDSSCYGNPDVLTPNMDQLAEEGMRFTHAFAASTLCSPSRAVIDTGLMPFRNGGVRFRRTFMIRDISSQQHWR